MQKTSYEMRMSDCSSDVCSSDLSIRGGDARHGLMFTGEDCINPHPACWQCALSRRRACKVRPARKPRRSGGRSALWRRPVAESLHHSCQEDLKSVEWGKRVSVSVDLGGALIITK